MLQNTIIKKGDNMPRFFAEPENIKGNTITLYSDDAAHISRVLRGKTGDILTVCDGTGSDYIAEITDISDKSVILEIKETLDTKSEPSVKITLYQGLPKGDKMELIIQKAVELGAYSVVPVAMKRSVVKLDAKKAKAKVERWNGIALSAAKQSKRSIQPEVTEVMTFKQALEYAGKLDKLLLPYECAEGMEKTRKVIEEIGHGESVGIFIGGMRRSDDDNNRNYRRR